MMCGEKDPFVDDTVIFAGRIRQAKRNNSHKRTQHDEDPDHGVTVRIMEGMDPVTPARAMVLVLVLVLLTMG